jgi:hypothetical protein
MYEKPAPQSEYRKIQINDTAGKEKNIESNKIRKFETQKQPNKGIDKNVRRFIR